MSIRPIGQCWIVAAMVLCGNLFVFWPRTTLGATSRVEWNEPAHSGHTVFAFGLHDLGPKWGRSQHQLSFMVAIDGEKKGWPMGPALDVLMAYEDGQMKGVFIETDLGLRWNGYKEAGWRHKSYPYLGGGGAVGYSRLSQDDVATDWGLGWWSQLGWAWVVDSKLLMVLEARYSDVRVDLSDAREEFDDINIGHLYFFGGISTRW